MKKLNHTMRRACPYCMTESEITNISVREIPGYQNSLNGKSNAIVEHLSCGHEFVDGKFNVDKIYFSAPTQTMDVKGKPDFTINPEYVPAPRVRYKRQSGGFNFMDLACMICIVFLAFTIPPLTILPVLYFLARINGK